MATKQRFKDLELISLVEKRHLGKLIDVFKYLNTFNNVSPRGGFNQDFNERTRNNGKILLVKRLNISVAQHFFRD